MTPHELRTAVGRLIDQVLHWTPSRWGAASSVSGLSRADAFHALVQRIADLAAAAEGHPQRTVPRLENDLALPDQLAVVTLDLLHSAPDHATLTEARAAIADARTALWGEAGMP